MEVITNIIALCTLMVLMSLFLIIVSKVFIINKKMDRILETFKSFDDNSGLKDE